MVVLRSALAFIVLLAVANLHATSGEKVLAQCDSICGISTSCEQECEADLFPTTCGAYDGGVENGWCEGYCGDSFCVLQDSENLYDCHEDCYPELPSSMYGVASGTAGNDEDCERVLALGVGSVRINAFWHLIQEDDQDPIDFSYLDEFVACVTSEDVEVYMTLGAAPEWAFGASSGGEGDWVNAAPRDSTDLDHWYDFVAAVIENYEYEVDEELIAFGVWNEPNFEHFLEGNYWERVYSYALLYLVADEARDAVAPNAVLGGPEVLAGPVYDFIDEIDAFMEDQDIISVHHYPDQSPSLKTYMESVADYVWPRDVWLTETGTTEASQNPQSDVYGILWDFAVDNPVRWRKTFIYVLYNGTNGNQVLIEDDETTLRPAYHVLRMHLGVPWPF